MATARILAPGDHFKDLETNIRNRDVLVVEDIIDTGHTLSQVLKIMQPEGRPACLSVPC